MLDKLMDFSPQSADELFDHLKGQTFEFAQINTWVSTFALAVNEENAGYGPDCYFSNKWSKWCFTIRNEICLLLFAQYIERDMIECILVAGEMNLL